MEGYDANRIEDSMAQCRKLLALLEEDCAEISKSLKGDIFDEYKGLLEREKELLRDVESRLRTAR